MSRSKRLIAVSVLCLSSIFVAACGPAAPNPDVLACIRSHESANVLPSPWHAYNPAGPYYGAYQYLQSTWDNHAEEAGRQDLIGKPPMEPYVSAADQDFVAGTWIENHGGSTHPWGNVC